MTNLLPARDPLFFKEPFFSPLIGFSPLIKGENFQIWELASK
jgi:hypothetical protein